MSSPSTDQTTTANQVTTLRLQQFVKDCTRTESPVETVETNVAVLGVVIAVLTAAGEMLDQIKKNAFYNRPFNNDTFKQQIDKIGASLVALKCIDDVNQLKKQPLDTNTRIFHSIVGIATESAELLQALKYDGTPMDTVNIGEELGDVQWYTGLCCDEINVEMFQVMTAVIEKLKQRFPDKFEDDKANVRDLDTERETLEQGINSGEK